MVYSPIMGAYRLNAEDVGVPDYTEALKKGLSNATDMYKPKQASEDLLAKMLENKLNKPKAEHAEEYDALQRNLLHAQISKALRGPQPAYSNLEKAMQGYERIAEHYGKDSQQANQAKTYIEQLAQGRNGISVTTDPDTGLPMVQIGGSQRGGQGGKLFQTESGETLSQPGTTVASGLQNRIVGAETVEPFLKRITETLPQFRNPVTKVSELAQGVSNAALGTNYKLPSKLASGNAAIKEASEGMLKSFGLNATGGNRQAMEDILTPHFGESEEGYRERVTEQALAYVQNKEMAKQTLRRGLNVGASSSNSTHPDPLGLR